MFRCRTSVPNANANRWRCCKFETMVKHLLQYKLSLCLRYFDSNTRRCEQFSYGGLKGNENNFVSQVCHTFTISHQQSFARMHVVVCVANWQTHVLVNQQQHLPGKLYSVVWQIVTTALSTSGAILAQHQKVRCVVLEVVILFLISSIYISFVSYFL
jgi:hypothetical protein